MSTTSHIVKADASVFLHSSAKAFRAGSSHNVWMDKNGGPNYLEAWRTHLGLTQEELAAAVNTTGSQISMLESGERGLSAKWLRKLAAALNTQPGNLLDHPPVSDVGKVISIFSAMSDDQRRMALGALEGLREAGQRE